jgi:hypothetical protein
MRRCAEILWSIRKDYRELSKAQPTSSWTETAHMEQSRNRKATFQIASLQFNSNMEAWIPRWLSAESIPWVTVCEAVWTRYVAFLEIVCLLDRS